MSRGTVADRVKILIIPTFSESENAMRYYSLLSIIARIHPEIWDWIIPYGPVVRVGSPIDRVALNPQPLPPRAAFLAGAAEMAHQVVHTAVMAELEGGSSSGFVKDLVDDWCGTPWPGRWPWPGPGPRPGIENAGPHPEPWEIATARVVGAIVFASAASRLAEGDLSATFAQGADRLSEAALAGTEGREVGRFER